MPSIEMNKTDLEELVGKKFASQQELEDALALTKTELESLVGDEIKASQADTNRPDLLSTEGIARELRYRLGKQTKIAEYKTKKSGRSAVVDPALEKIRPAAAYAVVWNVHVTDALLRQLIQLQEKICLTFGQKRKDVSIGIFDLDQVNGNVRYFAAEPKTEFTPLEYTVKMNLKEILNEHPKGKEYAQLLAGFSKYPLLVDEKNEVLSMPPIINSAGSGKVTEQTKNLFLDVTGWNQKKVETALEILCAALSDRGAQIGSVQIKFKNKTIVTPRFETKKIVFEKKILKTISGLEKKDAEWKKRFVQAGFVATFNGKKIACTYSSLRQDILHAVDLVEDVLICEGFNQIEPLEAKLPVIGRESNQSLFLDSVREACIGLGLQEILTYTLTSKQKQETQIGLQNEAFVEIANPTSTNYEIFRKKLFPELLAFLARNKNAGFPQHIFEIGKTLTLDSRTETGVSEKQLLCIALCNKNANFSQAKSHLQAVCNAFRWKPELAEIMHPAFQTGQTGEIRIGSKRGIIGMLNKKTLQSIGIETPTAVIEIELQP